MAPRFRQLVQLIRVLALHLSLALLGILASVLVPRAEDGDVDWEVCAGQSCSTWQPFLPGREQPRWKAGEDVWVRALVPSLVAREKEPVLYAPGFDQAVSVWLDGRRLATLGSFDGDGKPLFQGYPPLFLPLEPGWAGRHLVLQFRSAHVNVGFTGPPVFGGHRQVIERLVRESWPRFAWGACCIVLGLGVLGLFARRRREQAYLGYGCFLICLSLFLLIDLPLVRHFLPLNPLAQTKLWLLAVFFALPSFCHYVESVFGDPTPFRALHRLKLFLFWYGVVVLAAFVCNLVPVFWTMLPVQAAALLGIPGYFWPPVARALRGNRDSLLFLAGLTWLVSTAAADVLRALGVLPSAGFLMHVGLAIFVVTMGLVLARRFLEVHRKLEVYARDVERKNAELSRLNHLKDEFLANTTHELRTPLHGILGLADTTLTRAPHLEPALRRNLDLIIHSARRLLALVNDILDFSRLRHHDVKLELRPVPVRQAVSLAFDLLSPLTEGRALELRNEVDPSLEPLLADEGRVIQMLLNLVGNAIKFTEKGHILVTARPVDGLIEIAIEDTGVGIAAPDLERIFESYEQADGHRAGTGLGLAITRKLAELHGGTVRASSVPGQGSIFTLALPRGSRDLSPVEPLSSVRTLERSAAGECAGRILAVDDEPVNLHVVSGYLGHAGFDVTCVSKPREALERIRSGERFDLLLLDVMMPEMTGFDLCAEVRKIHAAPELPILLLTAKNAVEDLVHGFDVGANDFLPKPCGRAELVSRVRNHVDFKRLAEAMAASREEAAKVAKDLQAARAVQATLLPQDFAAPGLSVAVVYRPAQETSGDWYGYHPVPDSSLTYFLMGDVAGHGLPSALITGVVAGVVHSFFRMVGSALLLDPPRAIPFLARAIQAVLTEAAMEQKLTMTMAFLAIDAEKGILHYGNCGHPPVFVALPGEEVKLLQQRSSLLGLAGSQFRVALSEQEFPPGARAFCFTDGLIENVGSSGRRLRMRDLRTCFSRNDGSPTEILADLESRVCHAWGSGRGSDDWTALVIERCGADLSASGPT